MSNGPFVFGVTWSPLYRYFAYAHLPPALQEVSKPFHDLAFALLDTPMYDAGELNEAIRKLLEAKDCAVRAALEPK